MCVCVCVVQRGRPACGVVQQQWEGSQKHPTAEEGMVQSPNTHERTHAHTHTHTRENESFCLWSVSPCWDITCSEKRSKLEETEQYINLISSYKLQFLLVLVLLPLLFLFFVLGCASMDVLVPSVINALNGSSVKIPCTFTSCYKMDVNTFIMNWTYRETLNDTREMVKWLVLTCFISRILRGTYVLKCFSQLKTLCLFLRP